MTFSMELSQHEQRGLWGLVGVGVGVGVGMCGQPMDTGHGYNRGRLGIFMLLYCRESLQATWFY